MDLAQTAPTAPVAMLRSPKTGIDAWTRADLRDHHWLVRLDQTVRDELLQVAEALRAQPVPLLALRADSFDLPATAAAMRGVRRILDEGVRFALVDRLPLKQMSVDEAKALYWILSSMIARPVAQKLDGMMIYDVHDTGQKALPGSGIRPDKTNIDLVFHNDNAYNATMPEIVGLLCVRAAQRGGRSRVMSFTTAHNQLLARHPDLLPRLYQPFWFDRQREHRPDEAPVFAAPMFLYRGDALAARLALFQVRSGYAMQALEMDDETRRAIAAVEAVFADASAEFDFMMEPGQIQFVANREIGHARTEFEDAADDAQKRMLVRLWLRNAGAQGYVG